MQYGNKQHHNLSTHPLHQRWRGMIDRCYNKNASKYRNYGGRGIEVCKEWKDKFINFYNWAIFNGYEKHLSLDRIDNYGNYEPSNCRWVTQKQQCNNQRRNRIIEYEGKEYTPSELSEKTGLSKSLIYDRLNCSENVDDILRLRYSRRPETVVYKHYVEYMGETLNLKELSEKTGLDYSLIRGRHEQGKRGYDLIKEPRGSKRKCIIKGCEKHRVGFGYCQMHYARLKRNGSPLMRGKHETD